MSLLYNRLVRCAYREMYNQIIKSGKNVFKKEQVDPEAVLRSFVRSTFPRDNAWRRPDGYPLSITNAKRLIDMNRKVGFPDRRKLIDALAQCSNLEAVFVALKSDAITPREAAAIISEGHTQDALARRRRIQTGYSSRKADARIMEYLMSTPYVGKRIEKLVITHEVMGL